MGFGQDAYDIRVSAAENHCSGLIPDESGAVRGQSFIFADSLYTRLQHFVGQYGIEQRGIERVPEDEQTDRHTWKVGSMVRSQNLVKPITVLIVHS